MQLTGTEAWVRFLRKLYSVNPKGGEPILTVEVSGSYPFTDIPENSNLSNNPAYASHADGTARKHNRRNVNPPEVTVHNAGESFPKKYMDNFIAAIYTHDIKLPETLRDKVALVKNVFLEQADGSFFIMRERDHFVFERERHVITFHCEYFDFVPVGAVLYYNLELYTESISGVTEIIDSGRITEGEQIGQLSSLEADARMQIDFWGGDTKQTEWLLQRFKRAWINEKKMRQDLADFGIPAFNMSWDNSGISKNIDANLRPYLFNISAIVNYTTEYKLIQLSPDFLAMFDLFSGGDWRGETVADYEGRPIRRYVGKIAPLPMQYVFIDAQYNGDDIRTYTIPKGSSIDFEKL